MDRLDRTLRDGTRLCTDFKLVKQFDSPARVLEIQDAVRSLDGHSAVSRTDIDRHLSTPLSTSEAAALFSVLQKNGAAVQSSAEGESYADYSFGLDLNTSLSVLDQQAIVLAYTSERTPDVSNETSASFVATLPHGFEPRSARVRALPQILATIRTELFQAKSTVRIANPYFEPALELVDDLAGLPRRGIRTRILTRETADARGDLRGTLNRIWEQLESGSRQNLEIRDLFKRDPTTGAQTHATHAKMVAVDDGFCYVGSANLTGTSLTTNFELGVVVRGSEVADAVETFDEVFEFAGRVELPI